MGARRGCFPNENLRYMSDSMPPGEHHRTPDNKKGLGGVILINTAGDWAVKWTSTSMPWAAAKDGKLHSGIDLDDTSITDLP